MGQVAENHASCKLWGSKGRQRERGRERELAGSKAMPLKCKGGEKLRFTKFSWLAPSAKMFLMKVRFLPNCRKNSEMRQWDQESKVRIYLSKNMLSEGEGEDRWIAALGFFGKPVMSGIQMKGQNVHWARRGLGSYNLVFIPALPSQGEEGFFPYLALIGSVMASVHDGYFLSAKLILL